MNVIDSANYEKIAGGKSGSCEGLCNVSKDNVVTVTVTGNNQFHFDNTFSGHLVQGVFSANQVKDLNGNTYDITKDFTMYGHKISPAPIAGGHNYYIHF